MPNYHRIHISGGTYFFTLVTNNRIPIFNDNIYCDLLQTIIAETRLHFRFDQIAYCILPDHLHCIWTFLAGNDDYSSCWQAIKARFSIEYRKMGGIEAHISESRIKKRERGIWQRRFWEHTIRDELDLGRHRDYIHYNPIKHGLVTDLAEWRASSFHDYLSQGYYDQDWGLVEPSNIKKMIVDEKFCAHIY
jgi:putative transposase